MLLLYKKTYFKHDEIERDLFYEVEETFEYILPIPRNEYVPLPLQKDDKEWCATYGSIPLEEVSNDT